ncbi:MAG: pyridoxal-dependent decarboxylase [Pseudomonadota bacterium]|nr:pyridoxal-dependent decarboxylase [Pseudomonadota bacterium]
MRNQYQDKLARLRESFPDPSRADKRLVPYFEQALAAAQKQKNNSPIVGTYEPIDYDAACHARITAKGISKEAIVALLAGYCEGSVIPSHPLTQRNIVSPATIPSLLGGLYTGLYDPNLCWDEYSQRFALAEVEVAAMVADLVGYQSQHSGGLFTFGGVGTVFYGVKVGLEKAAPNTTTKGVQGQVAVLAGEGSHYCRYIVCNWLGIGIDNLTIVPADDDFSMNKEQLRQQLTTCLRAGKRVACIIATVGTTDSFGLDDLAQIAAVRDEVCAEFHLPYKIHIHADAVIGWAWAMFNDYDFKDNPLSLPMLQELQQASARVCQLQHADSLGIDFHKTGFTPYVSSMVLFKRKQDLQTLVRPQKQAPYLFQFGDYRPGMLTMEGTRAGNGVLAALANLKLFGKDGFRVLLAHLVAMAQTFRQELLATGKAAIINPACVGSVTLFRLYPDRMTPDFAAELTQSERLLTINHYNWQLFDQLHTEAMTGNAPVLSSVDACMHSDHNDPVLALKAFIISPFTDTQAVKATVAKIMAIKAKVDAMPATKDLLCSQDW